MKISIYIVLTILFISMACYKIQYTEARQLRETDSADREQHFTAGNTEDFGPTYPGNSPGIGHKLKENNEIAEGFKDDIKPMTPGHSLGSGHVVNNELKA
ncbi:precursor of CEP6 [Raphanus sativus]|uniref:Precursor of CEP6 n=1 Tax=Raphanus sativus TaxID=3726 RepID=A0A6J0L7T9_RAPSA|nr:precursor of CEP6 [Raphanus sativus]